MWFLPGSSTLTYRALFVVIGIAFLFFRILPLGEEAGALPGPDIILCVIFAWIVRRPDYLPVWLLALMLLIEDLVLMRPPGLWTALVVLASEFARSRVALTRELTFMVEWALVAGLMVGCLVAYRVVFTVTFLPQPALGFAILQILWSILCYPLAVGISRLAFDLRKPAMGEVDDYGKRL